MTTKSHWENVFSFKQDAEMSWTQASPDRSLQMIEATGLGPQAAIVDIGSGTSVLIKQLLDRGYGNLTVLDIAETALKMAKEKLGAAGDKVIWIASDVVAADLAKNSFDIWHDRAVFHFLTHPTQRAAYVARLRHSLKKGAFAVIATFGPTGPQKCSGLPVMRYDPDTLVKELGPGFELVQSAEEAHLTPWGKAQDFIYCLFRST